MAVEKRIPMRQCLGCRVMKPKAELIRIVRTPEGEIVLDRKGKANGRGAYICPCVTCFEGAVKKKAVEHALGCPVPAELKESLLQELEAMK